ncbi:Hypothetical protein SRAE_0000080400, partial [Strongyloides ratti]
INPDILYIKVYERNDIVAVTVVSNIEAVQL